MAIRKLPDGSIEADTSEELSRYLLSRPERDLRSVFPAEADLEEEDERQAFISPLFCWLPGRSRDWLLSPIACFTRPAKRR